MHCLFTGFHWLVRLGAGIGRRAGVACLAGVAGRRWTLRPVGPARTAMAEGRPVRAHRLRDRGMATAEYAVGMVAACGFAALLFKILTSGQVRGLVVDIVKRALQLPF